MEKCSLIFAEDGKSVRFHFEGGAESMLIYSKTEALNCVSFYAGKKKISEEEFNSLTKEIMEAKNLPVSAEESLDIQLDELLLAAIAEMGKVAKEIRQGLGKLPGSISFSQYEKKFEKATFVPCECGQKHGRIHIKAGNSFSVESEE